MRHEIASAVKVATNPFLNRAGLRGKDAIIAQMADDFRVVNANAGGVGREHLELLGWLPTQIDLYGADAARRARSDADRDQTRKDFRVSGRRQ